MADAGSPVLVVGTASPHVRRFVAGLCEAGQAVVLVTEGRQALVEHSLLREQVAVDFHLRCLGTASVIGRCIERWRPRVVHAHQANSVAWHAARGSAGRGVPLVVTLWGSDVLLLPQRSLLHRAMVRHTLRAAALWTADAAHVLDRAAQVAGQLRPSALLVMGVDSLPDDLHEVWPHKQPRLLSCRLHKPLYRVDCIIEAFSEVAARHPGWRLEVAASGPETAALAALAQRSAAAQVTDFSGFLDSAAMSRSQRAASVYVSFPESDGTSVSLLEALAQGAVPVVSDLPANREWVVDGLNGLVVRSPADLPAALDRAIALSQSTRWREETAPANLRLVRDKALFADNLRRCLSLYQGLSR